MQDRRSCALQLLVPLTYLSLCYRNTWSNQKLMPPVFYFMLLTHWTYAHFTELNYNIAETTAIFQRILHLCQPSLWPLNKNMCSHLVIVILSSLHGILQCIIIEKCCSNSCFLKDRAGDNLKVQDQDCKVDGATLSIPNLWQPLWYAHLCAA